MRYVPRQIQILLKSESNALPESLQSMHEVHLKDFASPAACREDLMKKYGSPIVDAFMKVISEFTPEQLELYHRYTLNVLP